MTIVCGIDAHIKELVCRIYVHQKVDETRRFRNTESGRLGLWACLAKLRAEEKASEVVIGYETCGLGYDIYDEATSLAFTCHILATTKMVKTTMDRKRKTDEYDAKKICDLLKAHVAIGTDLPSTWVPGKTLRDDRELIRRRFDVKAESTRSKNQIQSLLRRNGIKKPEEVEKPWTKGFMKWLASVDLSPGSKATLNSYIMQFEALEKNVKILNEAVEQLSQEKRYITQVEALVAITGVGILTAMVFLTELGDLGRFPNRRAFIAYIGMAPSSHESGDVSDRKGHITRCGSSRIRGILNQAVWARLRHDVEEKAKYEKYLETHKGGKKKAIVTFMSKLALTMWHTGLPAQYEYERRVA